MRPNVAAVLVALLLVGCFSDLLLAKGFSSFKSRGRSGYKPVGQPKKGLSNKAKIGLAAGAGVVGGMVIGSALSHGTSHGRMQNRYRNANGTWEDDWNSGMALSPLGSVWLAASVLSFAYCVAV